MRARVGLDLDRVCVSSAASMARKRGWRDLLDFLDALYGDGHHDGTDLLYGSMFSGMDCGAKALSRLGVRFSLSH